MSSNIDPITGLPDGYVDPLSYQIPLNSQPVLAPEWQPQGKIPQTLFPDNIPTFFATLQAMNGSNPSVVQALRTHPDTQAVEVYDLAAGGSSGGGVVATKTFETNQDITASSVHAHMTIDRICSFMMAVYLQTPAAVTDKSNVYDVFLSPSGVTSPRVQLGMVPVSVNGDSTNPLHFVAQYSHDFTNPLDPCTMLGLAPGSDLDLRAGIISWATGFAYMALHYT